jgi:hypothetical protein
VDVRLVRRRTLSCRLWWDSRWGMGLASWAFGCGFVSVVMDDLTIGKVEGTHEISNVKSFTRSARIFHVFPDNFFV